MPISKNGKIYFTEKQYQAARAVSALEYAQRAGYDLVPEGRRGYHLREHDSMVFTSDGFWFWNARKVCGRALEFMLVYEGMTLPEAVNHLAKAEFPHKKIVLCENKPFELPEKSPNYKRLFAYLCKSRGLDAEILQELIHQGRLYEAVFKADVNGTEKEIHNAVFVGLDADGIPRSGFQRGLNTFRPYKRDLLGSDKSVAFCVPSRGKIKTVMIFEASIDAISHATLCKLNGVDDQDMDRIALGGLCEKPLMRYLREHPEVRMVFLGLDRDDPGRAMAQHITEKLSCAGYTVVDHIPPEGKDWNDFLMLHRSAQASSQAWTP